jgi:hypothetical protein
LRRSCCLNPFGERRGCQANADSTCTTTGTDRYSDVRPNDSADVAGRDGCIRTVGCSTGIVRESFSSFDQGGADPELRFSCFFLLHKLSAIQTLRSVGTYYSHDPDPSISRVSFSDFNRKTYFFWKTCFDWGTRNWSINCWRRSTTHQCWLII